MANIKRGARAYYADTDYRRDGTIEAYTKIDGIPTPAAGDVGKVIKVGSDGYELAEDKTLPDVTSADVRKVLQVSNTGAWTLRPLYSLLNVITDSNGALITSRELGVRITRSGSTITRYIMGQTRSFNLLTDDVAKGFYIRIENGNTNYSGVIVSSNSNEIVAIVFDSDGIMYKAVNTSNDLVLSMIPTVTYIDVTASAGVVTLPEDVTYANIVALVTAGVNVQLRQILSSSNRYFHLMAYDETSGLYFENSYNAGTALSINEIHLKENVSEIRYKTITFDT